ncbi:MAG: flagellar basal body-associated FliL family protein [Bacillota bacterium]|nr:flagellar basal body-associated FliL family protein [Bacillota bacterium]
MGKGKGIVWALILVILVLLGGGFVWFQMQGKGPKAPPLVQVDMGEFTTNLADLDQKRYIQAQVILVLQGVRMEQKVGEEKAALKDAINTTLRSFTAAELQRPQGETDLKEKLQAALEAILGPGTVQKIYFPRLLIQ